MAKKVVPFPGDFPISSAVIFDQNRIMEISGQVGINPETKELEAGIEKQTMRVLENIKAILEKEGWSMRDIVKTNVFLIDMKDYKKMNEIYSRYFSTEYPARFALAVKELPAGALVEIACTAAQEK